MAPVPTWYRGHWLFPADSLGGALGAGSVRPENRDDHDEKRLRARAALAPSPQRKAYTTNMMSDINAWGNVPQATSKGDSLQLGLQGNSKTQDLPLLPRSPHTGCPGGLRDIELDFPYN